MTIPTGGPDTEPENAERPKFARGGIIPREQAEAFIESLARNRVCSWIPAALPAWESMGPWTYHRHGIAGPAWRGHDHMGGGAPHAHAPETDFQVPVDGVEWPHEETP